MGLASEKGRLNWWVDLVFYNFYLRRFVLFDLRTGKLDPRDVGQMDFYLSFFDDKYKLPDDEPSVGILLCSEKDEVVAKYSALARNENLRAAQFFTRSGDSRRPGGLHVVQPPVCPLHVGNDVGNVGNDDGNVGNDVGSTVTQSGDRVTQSGDPVERLLVVLGKDELSASELMDKLGLEHRTHFGRAYLSPALGSGLIERTVPDKPNRRPQKHRRAKS